MKFLLSTKNAVQQNLSKELLEKTHLHMNKRKIFSADTLKPKKQLNPVEDKLSSRSLQ